MYIHMCVDITLNIYIFKTNKHIANHIFFTMYNKFINYKKSAYSFQTGFLRIIIFTCLLILYLQ